MRKRKDSYPHPHVYCGKIVITRVFHHRIYHTCNKPQGHEGRCFCLFCPIIMVLVWFFGSSK